MGVTNYMTVNGKIRSEQRSGEAHSRDYVLDRLGSVIQIYQNGWPIADACYEPYGGIYTQWNMEGKTFTWLGGWGYRQTGVEWSSVYVRARHYSRGLSNWTSIDPLWPSEMAYGYVEGRVMTGVDYTGLFTLPWPEICKDNFEGLTDCDQIEKAGCVIACKANNPKLFALDDPGVTDFMKQVRCKKTCYRKGVTPDDPCCQCNPCPPKPEADPTKAAKVHFDTKKYYICKTKKQRSEICQEPLTLKGKGGHFVYTLCDTKTRRAKKFMTVNCCNCTSSKGTVHTSCWTSKGVRDI